MSPVEHLSVINLILEADWVVKLIMILLLSASVFSWMLVFNKISIIRKQIKNVESFESAISSCESLERLYENFKNEKNNIISSIFCAGILEYRSILNKTEKVSNADAKCYIANAMNSTYNKKIKALEQNMDLLATIASVSPFIGLLGTVWGIIDSFKSIAVAKSTSLLVVAPSIAEALFATALGLLVAIPASAFYNRISNNINELSNHLTDFISNLSINLIKKI